MNILSDIKSKVQTKELILEWIFIIILCMGIVIYYEKFYIKYSSVTGISVVILLNILKFCDKDDESIFGNRKSIFTFILAYIITLYQNKIFIYLFITLYRKYFHINFCKNYYPFSHVIFGKLSSEISTGNFHLSG